MGKSFLIFSTFLFIHLTILLNIENIPITPHDVPLQIALEQYPNLKPLFPLAYFDGLHYILIAQNGYGQFQQAFFPAFPSLIFAISKFVSKNYLIAGLIVSWVSLPPAILYFKKYTTELLGSDASFWATLFLLSFPLAFFYIAIYPESLFLFLSSTALYFIFKKTYFTAAIFAVLSSLTKIQGVFLIIPFTILALELKNISFQEFNRQLRLNYKKLIFAASPLYGLLIYSYYLFVKFGDPLVFYHSQEAFGAQRTSEGLVFLPQVLFRYFKILTTSDITFQYWIAALELLVFSFAFLVLAWDLYRLIKNKVRKKFSELFSLNLYSLAVIILPTLTGTFSSLPRYTLVSFGFFIALSKIKNVNYKIAIAIVFGIMHLILFSFFIKGYFVS